MTPIALVKGQLSSIVARIFGSEGGQLPLEVQSDMCEYPYVKVGRGQTGDNRADDVPMYLLLLLFSLVSIVVVLRTQCMQIEYFH